MIQTNLFDANYGNRIPSDICERKHGGNAESIAGNAKVDKLAGRNSVIAFRLGKPLHTLSGRVSELKMLGVVRATGNRRDGAMELALKI